MAQKSRQEMKAMANKRLGSVGLDGVTEKDAEKEGAAEIGFKQRKRQVSGGIEGYPQEGEGLRQVQEHKRSDRLKRDLLLQYLLILIRAGLSVNRRNRGFLRYRRKGRNLLVVDGERIQQRHGGQEQPKMLGYVLCALHLKNKCKVFFSKNTILTLQLILISSIGTVYKYFFPGNKIKTRLVQPRTL